MPSGRTLQKQWVGNLGTVHPWSFLRVLALLVAALGAYGVVSESVDIVRSPPRASPMPNPVVHNRQRAQPAEAVENFVRQYPGNFRTVVLFSLLMLALSIHFFGLLRDLHWHVPLAALLAALFLGGSVLCGLLVGISVLKLSEFARQASGVSAEQQAWLRGGISFLIQIHLIFVTSWVLCTGVGWVTVGVAALRARLGRMVRAAGGVELFAGLVLVGAVAARAWLPTHAETAPGLLIFLSQQDDVGMSVGFLASGVLAWLLAGGAQAGKPQQAASQLTSRGGEA